MQQNNFPFRDKPISRRCIDNILSENYKWKYLGGSNIKRVEVAKYENGGKISNMDRVVKC
jgi:hypothetical protein